jgi:hypothetical protein
VLVNNIQKHKQVMKAVVAVNCNTWPTRDNFNIFLLSAANAARAILQAAGTDLQFNLCGIAQRELASASHSNIIFTPARVAGEQKSKKGEERSLCIEAVPRAAQRASVPPPNLKLSTPA